MQKEIIYIKDNIEYNIIVSLFTNTDTLTNLFGNNINRSIYRIDNNIESITFKNITFKNRKLTKIISNQQSTLIKFENCIFKSKQIKLNGGNYIFENCILPKENELKAENIKNLSFNLKNITKNKKLVKLKIDKAKKVSINGNNQPYDIDVKKVDKLNLLELDKVNSLDLSANDVNIIDSNMNITNNNSIQNNIEAENLHINDSTLDTNNNSLKIESSNPQIINSSISSKEQIEINNNYYSSTSKEDKVVVTENDILLDKNYVPNVKKLVRKRK